MREKRVDVVAVDPAKGDAYRLTVGMSTIGTDDATVKYLGVRTVDAFRLDSGTEISFDVDWNDQGNGCYLSAAVYLCATATSANPEREKNWVRIEYIGVPPGKNARLAISACADGNAKYLYTEGWPENRGGRHIGVQSVKMIFGAHGFAVEENGRAVHREALKLNSESTYLYLVMSSHSNYPLREIRFGNVSVLDRSGGKPAEKAAVSR